MDTTSQETVDAEGEDTDSAMTQDESMGQQSEEQEMTGSEIRIEKQQEGNTGEDEEDEDDDDELEEKDNDMEIPQTPPSALHASGLRSPALAGSSGPRMQIDPSGSAKMYQAGSSAPAAAGVNSNNNSNSGSHGGRSSLTLVPTVTFRHYFPLLTDQGRILTPSITDAVGKEWRVLWYPHGHFMDDEVVSIFVEMVVDDDDAEANDSDELDLAPVEGSVSTVSRSVEVEFILVSQSGDPTRHRRQISRAHKFSPKSHEFGMSKFIARKELLNPENGFLTEDGRVEIEINLHTVESGEGEGDDDEGVTSDGSNTTMIYPSASPLPNVDAAGSVDDALAHQFLAYDSKQETGMVGLKNQGATCYMNSLLQTLFHLRAFRQVVYDTPSEKEDTNDSVSLALQRVFYRLQTQNKAVSTKELTRSFGWSQIDSFMQHDVQELYRILCDRLEEKMKNTKVDSAIKRLFEGKVRSFVQCVNVDFQSSRDESFYDLQLDVKGCKDIYESFRKYVEIEMLQGDNQYEAEGYGKQDAKKGIRFLQFPPVLNIQLKRFEYDPLRDGMVKIHDRFEFPKTLVLDDFISSSPHGSAGETGKARGSHVYHLHSVLVHSGDVHGGHYYVFIRPGKDIAQSSNWFRFDDDQISCVDEQTAIEGNYGSGSGVGSGPSTPLYSSMLCSPETPSNGNVDFRRADATPEEDRADDVYDYNNGAQDLPGTNAASSLMLPLGRSFSSAYMLVYVRDGDNDIRSIEEHDDAVEKPSGYSTPEAVELTIPVPLVHRFHEEEKASARRKKMQQTEHLYMTLRIASDTSVSKLKRITKNVDFSSFSNNVCLRMRIKRTASIRQLYQRIYKRTGVPVSRQRLWKIITRENRTNRPDSLVDEHSIDCVERLIDDDASPKAPVRLFLQILSEQTSDVDGTPKNLLKSTIHRHFWDEFTPPELSVADGRKRDAADDVEEDEEDEAVIVGDEPDAIANTVRSDNVRQLNPHEILLFIKFYDVKRQLGERLEYMGNIVVDARKTGAELAKYLHEALQIPFTMELILYEEIQPLTVSEIEMDTSLEAAEIQNGDIICYQYADDEQKLGSRSDESESGENGPDANQPVEKYPDVPLYFQYLLDRVEIAFHRYGYPQEEESFPLVLLYSNVYDEIIDAVAAHLGFAGEKRLYLRLYQHSPLNGLPKKNPLRHSKYSGGNQTTLDEFLTDYQERTNVMYYEILTNPITEIEAKKQVVVYFSIYDDTFVDQSAPGMSRRVEFLVLPNSSVKDLLKQIKQSFELAEETALRVCEVSHGGTMIQSILSEDTSLAKFWMPSSGYASTNEHALFVEKIHEEEIHAENADALGEPGNEEADGGSNELLRIGVVHFHFQSNTHIYIHTHGVPFVVHFRMQETVRQLKDRIRKRCANSITAFDLVMSSTL